MKDKREIAGLWWVPGRPEQKWIGTLTLECEQAPRLTLTAPQGFGFKIPELGDLLHGCDQHGKPATLLYPCEHHRSISGALTFLNYSSGFAILGIELPSRDAFQINCLSIELQHFYEWAGVSGFLQETRDAADGIRVHHRLPELKSSPLDADLTMEIRGSLSFRNAVREKLLTENSIVQLKSRKGLTFGECWDLVNAIRGLIHFGVLGPV
jgi:hypothetical protein